MSELPNGNTSMRFNKFAVRLYRWPGEWEVTIFLGPLQIRLGNMQQAAWWRHNTLFSTGLRVRECRRANAAYFASK